MLACVHAVLTCVDERLCVSNARKYDRHDFWAQDCALEKVRFYTHHLTVFRLCCVWVNAVRTDRNVMSVRRPFSPLNSYFHYEFFPVSSEISRAPHETSLVDNSFSSQ